MSLAIADERSFIGLVTTNRFSLASSEVKRKSDASSKTPPVLRHSHRPDASSGSDETSLASDPYTACDSVPISISVYSQSSTSLPYFRAQSIKSVEAYFAAKPVVAKAKKGKLSRACRVFLSGGSKQGHDSKERRRKQ